jgi:hypothetical protein
MMMMSNLYARIGVLVLLVLFSIFFGISLASKGMERVHGPIPSGKSEASIKSQASAKPLSAKAGTPAADEGKTKATSLGGQPASTGNKTNAQATSKTTKPELAGQKSAAGQAAIEASLANDGFMNNLGNKLGSLIQIVAHHSIQSVIWIFDQITH